MNKRFAKNLKKEMIEAEFTRVDLANDTGISLSSIHKYCTGERKPSWSQLQKIKNSLGCDISRLA